MSRQSCDSVRYSQVINNAFDFLKSEEEDSIAEEESDPNQNGKRNSAAETRSDAETMCSACDKNNTQSVGREDSYEHGSADDQTAEKTVSIIELNVKVLPNVENKPTHAAEKVKSRSASVGSPDLHTEKSSNCDVNSSDSGVVMRRKPGTSLKNRKPDGATASSVAAAADTAERTRVNTHDTAQSLSHTQQLTSTDGQMRSENVRSYDTGHSEGVNNDVPLDSNNMNVVNSILTSVGDRCSGNSNKYYESVSMQGGQSGKCSESIQRTERGDYNPDDRSRLSDSPKPSEDSDDDDDAGIYSDSYRNSKWMYVGDDGNTSFCPFDLDITNEDEFEEVEITEYVPINKEGGVNQEKVRSSGHPLQATSARPDKTSDHSNELESDPDITATPHTACDQLTTDSRTSDRSSGHSTHCPAEESQQSREDVTEGTHGSECVDGSIMGNGLSSLRIRSGVKSALLDGLDAINEKDSDDVFESNVSVRSHKRSESISTTVSELEFRKKYQAVSRKVVRRKSSLQAYQRKSERYFDEGRIVVVKKDDSSAGFGYHIHGCRPVMVSTVEPESPAERASLKTGDILLSVNGVTVAEADHNEVVNLMQQDKHEVRLEVIEGRLYSDMPLCTGYLTKQGGTGLLRSLRYRKRWFVLKRDNCLYYYKTPEDKDPLGAIPLTNYTINKATELNKNFAFKATKYGHRTYYFIAQSEEEMSRWAGFMTAAAKPTPQGDIWLDISSHNVNLPALSIKNPDCHGYLNKIGKQRRMNKRRYCVLKDACMYYYIDTNSSTAQGVAHLHGYTVEATVPFNKKLGFTLTPPEEKLRVFYFCADNETDLNRWVKALQTSIGRWVKSD